MAELPEESEFPGREAGHSYLSGESCLGSDSDRTGSTSTYNSGRITSSLGNAEGNPVIRYYGPSEKSRYATYTQSNDLLGPQTTAVLREKSQ